MLLIYNLGIRFFDFMVRILALFKEKPKLLHEGRKQTFELIKRIDFNNPIWIHCASLGEFEQGRPIIEAIKNKNPNQEVVLTFFSPSGYEVQKNYEHADYVFYMPSDRPSKVRKFVKMINPSKVVFVKYEFWYNYLKTINELQIPLYSVSAIFRPQHVFFKWYGKWNRKMLYFFSELFVQDEKSADLLKSIGVNNYTVAGDTRFDRVFEISQKAKTFDKVAQFTNGSDKVIVGGSSWLAGDKLLINYIHNNPDTKLLLAPHEIHEEHIRQIESLVNVPSVRYTKVKDEDLSKVQVLIVDTIGMLSSMYQYGNVAYIGGGFGSGIHNTIEASTFGLPVVFGPNYLKYQEACDLVELKGGFTIKNQSEFNTVMDSLLLDKDELTKAKDVSKEYVSKMRGATELIISALF